MAAFQVFFYGRFWVFTEARSSGGKVKLTVGSLKKALAASRRNKKKRVKILRYQSTMPASLCLQDAWRCAISDAK